MESIVLFALHVIRKHYRLQTVLSVTKMKASIARNKNSSLVTVTPKDSEPIRGMCQRSEEVRKVGHSLAELYVESVYLNLFRWRGAQATEVSEPLTYM
jgi:hypothetical protein